MFFKFYPIQTHFIDEIITSELCASGQYLDQETGCLDCAKNHWSSGGITDQCTPCPENTGGVDAGEGTKEDDCKCKYVSFFFSFFNSNKLQ